MDWARVLAYVTGTVDQELLARNEYLAAENRILKAQLKGPLKLSDAERFTSDLVGKIAGDGIARTLGRLQIVRRYDDGQIHVPRTSQRLGGPAYNSAGNRLERGVAGFSQTRPAR